MTLIQQIRRYASDIIGEQQLITMLEKSSAEKRPLRVKFGIDPTFPDVHLGHAVPIRLLRLFQDHGHLPILILGDGTARLGDPTGRNDQRPPLSADDVARNAETYLVQIGKILDLSPEVCEVRRNTEWFGKMDFFDCLQLASRSTAARLLERDDFQKRMAANLPVHLHEMMYPLMQGYDSVQVTSDIELGGNDQLFNLHMGRQMQERDGQRPQICITTPLLLGTDGRKMSKSYGNHVGLNASADAMFGKIMSLSDEGMQSWYALATSLTSEDVAIKLAEHPRAAKDFLARTIVAEIHDGAAAQAASEEFVRRFTHKETPTEIPVKKVACGSYALPALMKAVGLASSTSEARRLIEGGGVKLDQVVIKDVRHQVDLEQGAASVLMQAGKRRFAQISAE